jgi:ribonuclease P/MRP protein subunit RPP40
MIAKPMEPRFYHFRPTAAISFEFIISGILSFHFKSYISESQHGFVRGTFTQYVANSMDLGLQTDVIYTYFSKAFDRLGHEILVRKMKTLGWSSNFVNFLYSYQSGRKQFVSVHGHRSNVLDCSSGVPQGSMLGPPLFSIFINDIIEDLSVSCLLYADDMKIFTSIKEFGDCVRLQDNIDLISTWCIRNSLQLNITKCVVMTLSNKKQKIEFDYNINGVVLERPELVSDLGVLFDNKLSFTGHINFVIKIPGTQMAILLGIPEISLISPH